jgi:regulator of protease activity HflC (stomatin/prohibitin superfamily)
MAVNPRPNLNDLLTAFSQSVDDLKRNEELAGWARLLALLLACLFIGLAGPAFVEKRFMLSGSWLLYSLWFLAPAAIGITLAIISLGHFVIRMYGLRSLWHGIQYVISTTFGLGGSAITAKQGGQVSEENEAAFKIGGPGLLSVESGTAVVTERGSGFARMLGPGHWHLYSFERIRNVIDLRTLNSSSTETVLTKDGVPVRVNVSATFKMAKHMQDEVRLPSPRPGFIVMLRAFHRRPVKPSAPPLPASPEALRLATYDIPVPRNPQARPSWSTAAHGTVAGEVREALARRLLDQLFAPDDLSSRPRQEISNQVYEAGKAMLAKRGIDLVGLSFDNLLVPLEVDEQRCRTWQIDWEKESSITQADGEAELLLVNQRAYAEAQAELIQAVTQAIRTLAIRSTDETGAEQPIHPLALRFVDMVARAMDTSMRASSKKVISQSAEDILKQLRKKSTTDGKTSNRS